MDHQALLFVLFLAGVSSTLLALSATIFFVHRHLWGRVFVAALLAVAAAVASVVSIRGVASAVSATTHPGLRLAFVSTAIFIPLIVTQMLRFLSLKWVHSIENLLIKANDTGEWSDAWRAHFVSEHRAVILANTTAIQREWLSLRRRPLGPLPWFAALFLGESRDTIARYLRADWEEPQRQLTHAREVLDNTESDE